MDTVRIKLPRPRKFWHNENLANVKSCPMISLSKMVIEDERPKSCRHASVIKSICCSFKVPSLFPNIHVWWFSNTNTSRSP